MLLNVASIESRMLLTASLPSSCHEVGWTLAEGTGQRAWAGFESADALLSPAAGELVALGFGSAVAMAVALGVGVDVDDGVAVFTGSMLGTGISGAGGSSSARLTPTVLGTIRLSIRATTMSRRTVCVNEMRTIMRTEAECCR
jgi:hypothetical protein